MSFCAEVKNELISLRPQNCCKPSYAYGFMLFGRSFSIKKIVLQTGKQLIMAFVVPLPHFVELKNIIMKSVKV